MTKAKQTENEYTIAEAYRYLANAKETISKSPIVYGIYTDSKYVREAAGIAYLSALKALDVYFLSKGMNKADLPQSIEEYLTFVKKKIPLNGKLNSALTVVYQNLHIFAYYRGGIGLEMVKEGFDNARKVIEMMDKLMVKPTNQNFVSEAKASYKRPTKDPTPDPSPKKREGGDVLINIIR
ncbi:MAG: DUF5618 family protein [Bacteroidetes bacterium]|nr:DUF5618 family protein [Bacteroidota bacterium]